MSKERIQRQISIRGDSYAKLASVAAKRGAVIAELMDNEIADELLRLARIEVDEAITACFGVDANVSVDLKVERKIKGDRSARPIVWERGTRWHATAWRLGVPFDDDDDDIAEPCLETTDFHDRPEMALIQLADIIWERRGKAKNGGGS